MTQSLDLNRLSAVPLFSLLAPSVLQTLARAGETRLIAKGLEIGDRDEDCLLVLLSGATALSVREADRGAIFATVRAPRALNLACVTARAHCDIRWRALEDSAVFVLPGQSFRDLLMKDAAFAARAYGELAAAHQRLLSSAAGQRLQSAQRRVVDYLLSLTSARQGEARAQLPYEKHLLASLLGMTPENFSRTLGRLSGHGVAVHGAEVRINQVERLRAALGEM